jgi:glycine betaine/proline transport system ATP-binding protein
MDEPFSALDPLIRDRLQDELLELQARLHKTIVFVSHDLDEALKLGNQIAIMEGGRIVQAGPPETIVTRPATDYVRDFVAKVNPLRVLTAASVMQALDGTSAPIETALGRLELEAGAAGLEARLDGAPVALAELDAARLDAGAGGAPVVWRCAPATPMQLLVQATAGGRACFVVVDGAGAPVGWIGERQLFAALLR